MHCPDSSGGFGGHHGPHRLADSNSYVVATVTIYPNPVSERAVIHTENTSGNALLRIYDSNGRLTLEQTLTNGDYSLDKNNFRTGIYIYQVTDGNTPVSNGRLIFQ